jgi:SAM-dependent methyltransferase
MDGHMSALWEQHARHDPLWAILSDPVRRGRQWDLATFFETGRREISVLLQQIRDLGIAIDHDQALDFGCGVGRLTQALGNYFTTAVGVDISTTMIRLAEKLNVKPQHVRYSLNNRADLKSFSDCSFDLVSASSISYMRA